jgi:hypothetical protein
MSEQSNSEALKSGTTRTVAGESTVSTAETPDLTLAYESVRGFIREVSPLMSAEGMFVKTNDPATLGSKITFQMKVGDDFNLGKGTGLVVGRGTCVGVDGEIYGMALRFQEIDFSTRALVQRVVDQWVKADGIPFSLDQFDDYTETEDADSISATAAPPTSKPTPGLEALLGEKNSKLRQLIEESTGMGEVPVETDSAENEPATIVPESPAPVPLPVEMPDQTDLFAYDEDEYYTEGQDGRQNHRGMFVSAVVLLVLLAAGLVFKDDLLSFIRSFKEAPPSPSADVSPSLPGVQLAVSDSRPKSIDQVDPLDPIKPPVGEEGVPVRPTSAGGEKIAMPPDSGARESVPKQEADPVSTGVTELTGIDTISWDISAASTELSIVGNGDWLSGSYKVYRLGGRSRPRQLLKIFGVHSPFDQSRLTVGSRQVHQLRIGYHPEFDPPELHIVADLTHGNVELGEVREVGRRLVLKLTDP